MVYRCRETASLCSLRRVRVDAMLFAVLGAAGSLWLGWLLFAGNTWEVPLVLGLLVTVPGAVFGLATLRRGATEGVEVDVAQRVLTVLRGGRVVEQIPFAKITLVSTTAGLVHSLVAGGDGWTRVLFEDFLAGGRLYRAVARLEAAGVPVSPALKAALAGRGRAVRYAFAFALATALGVAAIWIIASLGAPPAGR